MICSGHKNWEVSLILLLMTMVVMGGCANKRNPKAHLTSPYGRQMTIAVVPVLNYSGNKDLDQLKVTDILYSEFQQVDGFAVIPVNRLLAQMMRDKLSAIETPQQALQLASELGADAIVVCAITEYNPYYPPVVGVAVQLYGLPEESGQARKIDPVAMERLASPLKVTTEIEPRYWPKNQMQRIYNSRDKTWAHQVEEFAEQRGTSDSPYKWEIYLRSQEYYLRFVYYKAIEELLNKELERVNPVIISDQRADVKEYN
ncbi:MAG: hypothetical protein WC975_07500 [Phycisphaerae bacterium]